MKWRSLRAVLEKVAVTSKYLLLAIDRPQSVGPVESWYGFGDQAAQCLVRERAVACLMS